MLSFALSEFTLRGKCSSYVLIIQLPCLTVLLRFFLDRFFPVLLLSILNIQRAILHIFSF